MYTSVQCMGCCHGNYLGRLAMTTIMEYGQDKVGGKPSMQHPMAMHNVYDYITTATLLHQFACIS